MFQHFYLYPYRMELSVDRINSVAQRIAEGRGGSRGVEKIHITDGVWTTLMNAIVNQRVTSDDKQPITSIAIGKVDDGDYEVVLPMNAPKHERGRLGAIADQHLKKLRLKERLKNKHAQKYTTASTS